MSEKKNTLIGHLEELRKVIIICLLAIIVGTALSYTCFQEYLKAIIFGPLSRLGYEPVVLSVTEGLFTQLKMAFLGGLFFASPIILWQVIGFVLPALYQKERKIFGLVVIAAFSLFILGILFGYKVILGISLKILLDQVIYGWTPLISAGKYVSFVLSLLLPFALFFEMPLLFFVLARLGIVSSAMLRKKRKYVILAIFFCAALFTPGGDIITQIIMAIPILLLFEVSILLTFLFGKDKKKEKEFPKS